MAARAQRNREEPRGYRRCWRRSLGTLAIVASSLGAAVSARVQAQSTIASSQASSLPAQSLPEAPRALLLASAVDDPDTLSASADPQQNQTPSQPAAPAGAVPAQTAPSASAPAPKRSSQTEAADRAASASLPPCPRQSLSGTILFLPGRYSAPCREQNPLQAIVDSGPVRPLTPREKGILAIRDFTDPFNFITIGVFSGITIATDSHTAYGPGIEGFGRLAGYSLVGAIQGDFIGVYAIPALTHEDPRYHRLPGRPFTRRLEHAIVHTYVTQHDNGSLMPNYSVLLGYPIGNELANLYVPGLQTNGPATTERIAVGIGTDPVGAIIAEFLPDVAKHIHIHIIFMQQILNQVANGGTTAP